MRKADEVRPVAAGAYEDFNGAATYSLRKVVWVSAKYVIVSYFNGAATYSLRKAVSSIIFCFWLSVLQWGRNILVAER